MITLLFAAFVAAHVIGAWLYIRRTQAEPTLGEAYRDETLNRHSDPL